MLYALPTALFVAAEDKAYFVFGFVSLFNQIIHCIKTAQHRSFIVEHASAVQIAVFNLAERVCAPLVLVVRYYVYMSEYAESLPFSYIARAVIAFFVVYGHTHLLCGVAH